MNHKLVAIYLLFKCSLAAGQQVCSGNKALLVENIPVDNRPYHLVFEDEFGGNVLDTTVWSHSIGVVRDMEYKTSKQWYQRKNVEVRDGKLILTMKREVFMDTCYTIWEKNQPIQLCSDFYYSAGEIKSLAAFSHGRFEIRCRLPNGKGLATAFWMYTRKGQNEIDVFEFYNEYNAFGGVREKRFSTVQKTNSRTDYEDDGVIEDCSAHGGVKDFSSDFHIFELEWTPTMLVWKVDGEIVRSTSLFYSLHGQMLTERLSANNFVVVNKAFPRYPMEIYISTGVQSDEDQPEEETVLPATFEIDYIRYYKK